MKDFEENDTASHDNTVIDSSMEESVGLIEY
jgi:hypothetical protein